MDGDACATPQPEKTLARNPQLQNAKPPTARALQRQPMKIVRVVGQLIKFLLTFDLAFSTI
jgi:hypothetical protein